MNSDLGMPRLASSSAATSVLPSTLSSRAFTFWSCFSSAETLAGLLAGDPTFLSAIFTVSFRLQSQLLFVFRPISASAGMSDWLCWIQSLVQSLRSVRSSGYIRTNDNFSTVLCPCMSVGWSCHIRRACQRYLLQSYSYRISLRGWSLVQVGQLYPVIACFPVTSITLLLTRFSHTSAPSCLCHF